MVREPPRQIGQHIAAAEDADKRRKVVERPRRANLYGQTPAGFFIAADRSHGFLEAQQRAIVQGADQLLGLDAVRVRARRG